MASVSKFLITLLQNLYSNHLTAGPEVVEQAIRVLEVVIASLPEVDIQLSSYDFGGAAIDKHGDPLPDATLKACQEADAILMGG